MAPKWMVTAPKWPPNIRQWTVTASESPAEQPKSTFDTPKSSNTRYEDYNQALDLSPSARHAAALWRTGVWLLLGGYVMAVVPITVLRRHK